MAEPTGIKCFVCGEDLPYSALRNPNSFANRKKMHRKCYRLAQREVARTDYLRRKLMRKKHDKEHSDKTSGSSVEERDQG
jgi:hypothetical protein